MSKDYYRDNSSGRSGGAERFQSGRSGGNDRRSGGRDSYNGGNRNGGGRGAGSDGNTLTPVVKAEDITENSYIVSAEKVIKELQEKKIHISTTKLRSILAMSSDIYNDVIILTEDKLPQDVISRINYMKLKLYYESGRGDGDAVRKLLSCSNIFSLIEQIGDSRKKFILFNRYMEALVAFHKYYGLDK